jgi:hypothetical protein
LGRVASTDYATKKNIWVHPDLKVSKSEARRLVEETPQPLMVRVK